MIPVGGLGVAIGGLLRGSGFPVFGGGCIEGFVSIVVNNVGVT